MKRTHPRYFRLRRRFHHRGSVLVLCMVLAALGTLGIAGWMSLMTARSNAAQNQFDALNRKIVTRNSKILATEAAYREILNSPNALGANKVFSLASNHGKATFSPFSKAPLPSTDILDYAALGPVGRSYSTETRVAVTSKSDEEDWQFYLRSYHPALSGELFTAHVPNAVRARYRQKFYAGEINVHGQATFHDVSLTDLAPSHSYDGGLYARSLLLPHHDFPTDGIHLMQPGQLQKSHILNLPHRRQAMTTRTHDQAYDGRLTTISTTDTQSNTYRSRVLDSGAAHHVVLDGRAAASLGAGPARFPALSDATLEQTIADTITTSMGTGSITLEEYRSRYPLSSPLLITALNHPDAFSAGSLRRLLDRHQPLAQDVVTHLNQTSTTGFSEEEKRAITSAAKVWVSSNGSGKITIYMREGLTHILASRVTHLEIVGATSPLINVPDANFPPRAIVIDNPASTYLEEVKFLYDTSRRLALAIKTHENTAPRRWNNRTFSDEITGGILAVTSHADAHWIRGTDIRFLDDRPMGNHSPITTPATWPLILDLENTDVDFHVQNRPHAVLVGGIRTDSTIKTRSGSAYPQSKIHLQLQTNHTDYEKILPRVAWLERFRQ